MQHHTKRFEGGRHVHGHEPLVENHAIVKKGLLWLGGALVVFIGLLCHTADNTVVWDVKPLSTHSECWNNCWNLKFQVGPNQSSFMAGHQAFVAQVPQAPTFSLARGTLYLFEAWDGKGRVQSDHFRL